MKPPALLGFVLVVFAVAVVSAHGEEENEAKKPGWLGVSLHTMTQGDETVIAIRTVVEGSPAEKAGLKPGDVLVRTEDRAIDSMEAVRETLSHRKAGEVLRLQVRRSGELLNLEVTLEAAPPPKPRGIQGKKAPPWKVERWAGLGEGIEKLDVQDLKGKVVYLYCFQSWCPGCHSQGFPTLQAVQSHFEEARDVVFVVMQTVFEGFETNTFERGQATLKKFELTLPYALSGGPDKRSEIMRAYNTGGTPWTIVIDPAGVVRFDGFRIEAKKAIELIDKLRPVPEPTEGAGADPGE